MEGVALCRGDITDEAFATEVCAGATSIYDCLNPREYHRWDELLPPLTRAAADAAKRSGARLVVLDNFYMVGRPSRSPFAEDEPLKPCSDKGRLRAALYEELRAASDAGDLEVTWGRASDFFGPDTPFGAVFNPRFFRQLAAGRKVFGFGDPDQPHSYSYTPDVARGLEILGTHDAAVGNVWHLPVAAQISTRQLVDRFAGAAGTAVKIRIVRPWILRALGLFAPAIRAAAEMVYQWEVPYLASDERFRRTFGVAATDLDTAIADTLAAHGVDSARASRAA